MLSNLPEMIVEFMTTPDLPGRLGIMMAVATLIGFMIYEDSKGLTKWMFTGFIYVIFQEWMRTIISDNASLSVSTGPFILSIISSFLYGVCIIIGALLNRRIGIKMKVMGKIERKIIDNIRSKK